MIGTSIEKVLKAADIISEIRKAFEKIQNLEIGQRSLADALDALEARVRELEASLREAKAEIKLAAVEAAQQTANGAINGAQGQLFQKMVDLEVQITRMNEEFTALQGECNRRLPPP